MSQLYNLAYISKNSITGSPEKIKSEIRDILAAANKNNPKLGVTGALLYSGGYFCQVIEGPQDVLEELFETIQMDGRHKSVTILHFEPIESRGFTNWAMAFAGIEDKTRFDIEGVLASKDEMKMRETGHNLVTVLDSLVKQHQDTLIL